MADRRIGDEPLEIGLHQCHERPVENPDHAQAEEPRGGCGRRVGKHRQREPQEAVDADLEQHPGQIDAATRGGLDVGQRQPGVEGNDRDLHGEAGEEREKHDHLQPAPFAAHRERVSGRARREGGDVEGDDAGVRRIPEHDREQAEEGQHAAGERVDEELHRRPTALIVAPDPDQEEERHEREFEEHVEQDHVPRREDAEHRRFQEEQQHVEPDRLLLDRVPTDEHRREGEQGREAEQPDRQAVEAQRQSHVENAAHKPGGRGDGIGTACGGLRALQITQHEPASIHERDQRRHHRALPHRREPAATEHPGHDGADERRGDHEQKVRRRGKTVHGRWSRWKK